MGWIGMCRMHKTPRFAGKQAPLSHQSCHAFARVFAARFPQGLPYARTAIPFATVLIDTLDLSQQLSVFPRMHAFATLAPGIVATLRHFKHLAHGSHGVPALLFGDVAAFH